MLFKYINWRLLLFFDTVLCCITANSVGLGKLFVFWYRLKFINKFITNCTNISFTIVLLHVSATTCNYPQGVILFKDIHSVLM